MLHRVYINIGSNSGHRHALIERAVTAVSLALGGVVSRSDIIETEPWGFSSPNPFLNVGLMVELEGEGYRPVTASRPLWRIYRQGNRYRSYSCRLPGHDHRTAHSATSADAQARVRAWPDDAARQWLATSIAWQDGGGDVWRIKGLLKI